MIWHDAYSAEQLLERYIGEVDRDLDDCSEGECHDGGGYFFEGFADELLTRAVIYQCFPVRLWLR
jgi:hypothetical protein